VNTQDRKNRANNGDSERTEAMKETLESVKQKASETLSQAQQTVSGVVSDAVSEAKSTASGVVEQATQEAQGAVDQQKARAADRIESVAGALRQTGAQLEAQDQGAIANYTNTAAEQLERFSDFLNNRNATELLQEVDRFARRQPELFVAGALAGGFLLGRFLKSTNDRRSSGGNYGGNYNYVGSQYGNQYGNQYGGQSGYADYGYDSYARSMGNSGRSGSQGSERWQPEVTDSFPRASHGAVEDPQPASNQVTGTYEAGDRVVAQQTYEAYEAPAHLGGEETSERLKQAQGNDVSANAKPNAGDSSKKTPDTPGSAQRDPIQDPGPR
jgi:hypothetical protein